MVNIDNLLSDAYHLMVMRSSKPEALQLIKNAAEDSVVDIALRDRRDYLSRVYEQRLHSGCYVTAVLVGLLKEALR